LANAQALRSTVQRRTDHESAFGSGKGDAVMAKSILIVDDDEGFLLAGRRLLEAAGYEVQTAPNVAEARRRLASKAPDLILLDVVMPAEDGFTFSDELARDPHLCTVPVVLCSVVAENAGHMMRAFESDRGLAAKDFASKADLGERLLEVVESAIGKGAHAVRA
jgi:CheY-like chemotaxis protein